MLAVQKSSLPRWIKGKDRAILAEFITGTKPARILETYGLAHHELATLRYRYGIPSQVVLRQANGVEFGPKKRTRREIQLNHDARLQRAIDEYVKEQPSSRVVSLARKYHVTTKSLSEALQAKGFQIHRGRKPGSHDPQPPSERDLAIIEAVVQQRRSMSAVAQEQQPPISRERVRQILAKAGYRLGHRPLNRK